MATSLRMHCGDGPAGGFGVYMTLCGIACARGQIAGHPLDVDCELCKPIMGAPEPVPEPTDNVFHLSEYHDADWMSAPGKRKALQMPPIDRDNWRCHVGHPCGHCDTCTALDDIDRLPSDHDAYRRGSMRKTEPHIDVKSMVPSLSWYTTRMEDGARMKGGNDWVLRLEGIPEPQPGENILTYRSEALAMLAVSEGSIPDDGAQFGRAVLKRRIEYVLSTLYRRPGRASRSASLRILFARVVGVQQDTRIGPRCYPVPAIELGTQFNVTPGQVGAIVRDGKLGYMMGYLRLEEEMERARMSRETPRKPMLWLVAG